MLKLLVKAVSKALRVTKIVKETKFEGVWDELESKKGFQRESVTKYLRLTLVFVWSSAPRERFNGYFLGRFAHRGKCLMAIFWGDFASAGGIFILAGGLATGLSFYGV